MCVCMYLGFTELQNGSGVDKVVLEKGYMVIGEECMLVAGGGVNGYGLFTVM